MKKRKLLSILTSSAIAMSSLSTAFVPSALAVEVTKVPNAMTSTLKKEIPDDMKITQNFENVYASIYDSTPLYEYLEGLFSEDIFEYGVYLIIDGEWLNSGITPAALYENTGKNVLKAEIHDSEDNVILDKNGNPLAFNIYLGIPGDANLDGYIDAVDASNILAYYACVSTGVNSEEVSLVTVGNSVEDPEIENLAGFLADVDGFYDLEKYNLRNKSERYIDPRDASYILRYSAEVLAGNYHNSLTSYLYKNSENAEEYEDEATGKIYLDTISAPINMGFSEAEIEASELKPKFEIKTNLDNLYGYEWDEYFDSYSNDKDIPVCVSVELSGADREYSSLTFALSCNNRNVKLNESEIYPGEYGVYLGSAAKKLSAEVAVNDSENKVVFNLTSKNNFGLDGEIAILSFTIPAGTIRRGDTLSFAIEPAEGSLFRDVRNSETSKLAQAYLFKDKIVKKIEIPYEMVTTTTYVTTTSTTTTTTTTTAPVSASLYGDANDDGTLGVADITFFKQHLIDPSNYPLTARGEKNIDLNFDGKIDIADYEIFNHYLSDSSITLAPASTYKSGDVKIELDTIHGKPGEQLTLNAYVRGGSLTLSGMQFKLDGTYFKVIDFESDASCFYNDNTNTFFISNNARNATVKDGYRLFSLKLQVPEDTLPAQYPVGLKNLIIVNENGEKLDDSSFNVNFGNIIIEREVSTIKCDANGDGSVDLADVVSVVQYLINSDKYPLSEQGKINADVDGDSTITTLDLQEIQDKISGYIPNIPVAADFVVVGETRTARPGEYVEVSFNVSNRGGHKAAAFLAQLDTLPVGMELLSVEDNYVDVIDDFLKYEKYGETYQAYLCDSKTGDPVEIGNGEVITFAIKVPEDAPFGEYEIPLKQFQVVERAIDPANMFLASLKPAKIIVEDYAATTSKATEASTETTAENTTSTAVPETTTTSVNIELTASGDANCDGFVNFADSVAIMQYISNLDKYALSEQGRINADINGDSDITGTDALTIMKYIAFEKDDVPDFIVASDFIIKGSDYTVEPGENVYVEFMVDNPGGHKAAGFLAELDTLPAGIIAEMDDETVYCIDENKRYSKLGNTYQAMLIDNMTADPVEIINCESAIGFIFHIPEDINPGVYEYNLKQFQVVESANDPVEMFLATIVPGRLTVQGYETSVATTSTMTSSKSTTSTVISSETNSATTSTTASTETTTTTSDDDISVYMYGDVNCDGVVSEADYVFLTNSIVNSEKYQLSAQGKKNADLSIDGKVDIADVEILCHYLRDSSIEFTPKGTYKSESKEIALELATVYGNPGETVTIQASSKSGTIKLSGMQFSLYSDLDIIDFTSKASCSYNPDTNAFFISNNANDVELYRYDRPFTIRVKIPEDAAPGWYPIKWKDLIIVNENGEKLDTSNLRLVDGGIGIEAVGTTSTSTASMTMTTTTKKSDDVVTETTTTTADVGTETTTATTGVKPSDPIDTGILYGDANLDGVVNVADMRVVINHIRGTEILTDYAFTTADVNNDGVVNVADMANISKKIADSSFKLPAETGTYTSDSEPSISICDVEVEAGEYRSMELILDNGTLEFSDIQFSVDSDSPVSFYGFGIMKEPSNLNAASDDGICVIHYDENKVFEEGDALFYILMKIPEGTPSGDYKVSLKDIVISNSDGEILDNSCLRLVDGKVKVKGNAEVETLSGDVNNDGSVNLKDVVLIRRYIADGWNVEFDENIADVNKDGSVNLKDVVLIRRYIADGWNVELK